LRRPSEAGMDLRQLEMFQAIVETGSFTRAGEKLFVSQSAISRQIKLLEEELGDQVFERIHRKVYLTQAGEVLLKHSRQIFGQIRTMTEEIADLTHLRRGTLRLAGGMSVCTYLFPKLLKYYRYLYPQVEVVISTGVAEEILRGLRINEIDLALLSLPYDEEDLEVHPAITEELVLIMEPNHPLAHKDEIQLSDLEPYTFIHFERGSNTRKVIEQALRDGGIRPRNTMELQNVEIIKPLVENGLGVSIVPLPAVMRDVPRRSLHYRRIKGRKMYRELGWVALKSNYISAVEKQLLTLFDDMHEKLLGDEE